MVSESDETLAIYGLDLQARSLCAMDLEETDISTFLVATQSLRETNQIHLLSFNDVDQSLKKRIFCHDVGDVWNIKRCEFDCRCFVTMYGSLSEDKSDYRLKASLWRLPNDVSNEESDSFTDATEGTSLTMLQDLPLNDFDALKDFCCCTKNSSGEIIALTETELIVLKSQDEFASAFVPSPVINIWGGLRNRKICSRVCWNPNSSSQVAIVSQRSIFGMDLRSSTKSFCIENAHAQLVRDLDYNPYGEYYLASCGDDCALKVWDVRNCQDPMKVVGGVHSYWIWTVRFNPSRDLLLLTGSSDSRVALYALPSCVLRSNIEDELGQNDYELIKDEEFANDGTESARNDVEQDPLTKLDSGTMRDEVLTMYEDHEDSVYACEWSTSDPWIFATLSYDGRVVINRVPYAEKLRIIRSGDYCW